jgi:hypothetical protein
MGQGESTCTAPRHEGVDGLRGGLVHVDQAVVRARLEVLAGVRGVGGTKVDPFVKENFEKPGYHHFMSIRSRVELPTPPTPPPTPTPPPPQLPPP